MKTTIMLTMIALLILSACGTPDGAIVATAQKPVVKIGMEFPLTGDIAFLGQSSKNAVELALKEIQEKGTKYDYELVFEDTRLDSKTTATATTKLIDIDKVDAIISFTSGTGNIITPMAEQAKVIHFCVASDANVAKGTYNFIHWTPPSEEAKVWVKEAQRRGIKSVAVLYVQQQGFISTWNILKPLLEETGIKAVYAESFASGEKDFRTMLLKANEKKPEIYLLGAFSPDVEQLYKQYKELGFTAPVSGIESFELSDTPELFEGNWFVNAADPSDSFRTKYEAAYNSKAQLGAGNSYDMLKLIVEGYERAGTGSSVPDNADVVNALLGINGFPGALGQLSMGTDHIVWSPAVVKIIKDGKPVTIAGG